MSRGCQDGVKRVSRTQSLSKAWASCQVGAERVSTSLSRVVKRVSRVVRRESRVVNRLHHDEGNNVKMVSRA